MGTSNDLSTKSKICDAALALLRQDIGYSSSTSIQKKCDNAWKLAWDGARSVHEWKSGDFPDWVEPSAGSEGAVPSKDYIRGILVYSLARELAMPVTGRQEDLNNMNALFEERIGNAIIKNIEEELDALRSSQTDDDKFAVQVIDTMRRIYSYQDSEVNRGGKRDQYRGVASIVKVINSIKEKIRKDILLGYEWSFSKGDCKVNSVMVNGRFETAVPGVSDRIITCERNGYKIDCRVINGKIVSETPIDSVTYVFDDNTVEYWSELAKEAYVYQVAKEVMIACNIRRGEDASIRAFAADADRKLQTAKTIDARSAGKSGSYEHRRNYLVDAMTNRDFPHGPLERVYRW